MGIHEIECADNDKVQAVYCGTVKVKVVLDLQGLSFPQSLRITRSTGARYASGQQDLSNMMSYPLLRRV